MSYQNIPRYDFGALWDVAQSPSFLELARRLGIAPRQLYRWAHYGIPDDRADALAVALGHVPYRIWPEWLRGSGTEVRDWVAETAAERARRREEEQARRRAARTTIQKVEKAEKVKRQAKAERLAPRVCEHCGWGFVPKNIAQRFCRMRCAEDARSSASRTVSR